MKKCTQKDSLDLKKGIVTITVNNFEIKSALKKYLSRCGGIAHFGNCFAVLW